MSYVLHPISCIVGATRPLGGTHANTPALCVNFSSVLTLILSYESLVRSATLGISGVRVVIVWTVWIVSWKHHRLPEELHALHQLLLVRLSLDFARLITKLILGLVSLEAGHIRSERGEADRSLRHCLLLFR